MNLSRFRFKIRQRAIVPFVSRSDRKTQDDNDRQEIPDKAKTTINGVEADL